MNRPLLKVLVVDDDKSFTKAVSVTLGGQVEVQTASGLQECKSKLTADSLVDVVITDYRMSSGDGHAVLAYARKIVPDIPVIMVTAFACKDMAVRSVNLSVFALLEKPVDLCELTDAVKRAAKASGASRPHPDTMTEVVRGPFTLRPSNFSLAYRGQDFQLTETEFRILYAMVLADSRRISRAELVRLVWGSSNLSPNLFDTHLLNLRRKLPQLKTHLQVVRGKGYIFSSEKEA